MRKLPAILASLAGLTLSGCAAMALTTPDVTFHFHKNKDPWPAIVTAFQVNNAQISSIDIFQNEYKSGSFDFMDLIVPRKAKFRATAVDTTIEIGFSDMLMWNEGRKTWEANDATLGVNKKDAINQVKLTAQKIYDNDSLYSFHRQRLLTNFNFNYLAMKRMNEVARKIWLDSLKGKIFAWTGDLQDLKNNPDTTKVKAKYLALFAFSTDAKSWEIGTHFYVRLYTNNSEYIRANKGTKLNVAGRLLNATVTDFLAPNFYYEFQDTASGT